jgi:hypothetical protein
VIDRNRRKAQQEAQLEKQKKEDEELMKLKNYRGLQKNERKPPPPQQDEMDSKEMNPRKYNPSRNHDPEEVRWSNQHQKTQKGPRMRQPEVDFDKRFGEEAHETNPSETARNDWNVEVNFGEREQELTFGQEDLLESKKKSNRFQDDDNSPVPVRNKQGFGKFKQY